MKKREDLRKLSELGELRSKKLDEIRVFLSISSETADQAVLGMMKWWQETAADEPSVPVELKTRRLYESDDYPRRRPNAARVIWMLLTGS
jgi:hypothetical protein